MSPGQERRKGPAEIRQLIGFLVGPEEYGLEILRVREIIRVKEITRLPGVSEFMKGVINLRGDVIPILDLGEKLGLNGKGISQNSRVIVVEVEGRLIGLMVDAVSQVLRIPVDQIDPPPQMISGPSREFVSGVGKVGDRLVLLLQIERVLSGEAGQAAERAAVEA